MLSDLFHHKLYTENSLAYHHIKSISSTQKIHKEIESHLFQMQLSLTPQNVQHIQSKVDHGRGGVITITEGEYNTPLCFSSGVWVIREERVSVELDEEEHTGGGTEKSAEQHTEDYIKEHTEECADEHAEECADEHAEECADEHTKEYTETQQTVIHWRGTAFKIEQSAYLMLYNLNLYIDLDYNELMEQEGGIRLSGGFLHAEKLWVTCSNAHAIWADEPQGLILNGARLHHSGRCGLFFKGRSHQERGNDSLNSNQGDQGSQELRGSQPTHSLPYIHCENTYFEMNGEAAFEREGGEEETDGVWCEGEARGLFLQCSFLHNKGDGLYIKRGHYLVQECRFIGNEVNGLYYGEGASGEVSQSKLKSNHVANLGLKGANVRLKEVSLTDGLGVGLFCLEGVRASLDHVYIHQHVGVSLLIDGGEDKQVFTEVEGVDCEILDGESTGLMVTHGAKASFKRCHFSDHTDALVAVNLYAHLHLSHSDLRFGGVGVFLSEGGSGLFQDLTIQGGRVAQVMVEGVTQESLDPSLDHSPKREQFITPIFERVMCTKGGGVGFYFTQNALGEMIGCRIEGTQKESLCVELMSEIKAVKCSTSRGVKSGVVCRDKAHLTLTACSIERHKESSVEVSKNAYVSLRECQLYGSKGAGLWVKGGKAELYKCHISHHHRSNIFIQKRGDVNSVESFIYESYDAGIFLTSGSYLNLNGGEVHHNRSAGVWVDERSSFKAYQTKIYRQKSGGVFYRGESSGELVECDIYQNQKAGVESHGGSTPRLIGCQIYQGDNAGVLIQEESAGHIERCDIHRNVFAGIAVKKGGEAIISQNQISYGEDVGIWLMEGAKGEVKDNWIFGHEQDGIKIEEGALSLVFNNHIQSIQELNEMMKH